jgi:flagellar assembly protein FliH
MKSLRRVFKASDVRVDDGEKYFIETRPIVPREPPAVDETAKDVPRGAAQEDLIREDARKKAEKTIKKAQVDAMKILCDVKAQCDKLRQETEDRAREEGYGDGFGKGAAKSEELTRQAEEIFAEAEKKAKEMMDEAEPRMIDLVMRVSENLLKGYAKFNPDAIMVLLKQGLSESTITGDIIIRVSKEDFDTVNSNKDEIKIVAGGGTNIEVVSDLGVNRMDCVIETPFGNIDCSLDQQFDSLKQNIYLLLNGAKPV